MRTPSEINEASMNVCKKCQGKGAVKAVPYPSRRDLPCFWFAEGARTCPSCDGTGETDDGGRDGRA
ncbi:hypothetical protein SY26_03360 [Paracoccus sp. 228]|nr:hypothetical protein SY26_03360 [Paracoccus sp. 228]